MDHISLDFHKQQNILTGTFKVKEIMLEHESEEKFDRDNKCVRFDDDPRDWVLGDGLDILMVWKIGL